MHRYHAYVCLRVCVHIGVTNRQRPASPSFHSFVSLRFFQGRIHTSTATVAVVEEQVNTPTPIDLVLLACLSGEARL